ncbi:2-C-methyl-D-erythritol 4-phosphate cytidylyltransferase, partial [Amycolatopsis sp. NPDC000740]
PLPGAIRVQTPQGFRAQPLLAAYEQAAAEGFLGTDTASCMERFSALPVRWVPGSAENVKITYPHDLAVAERFLLR